MIETLNTYDVNLFVLLNSLHNEFFDKFMWLVSGKFEWIAMYVMLTAVLFRRDWRSAIAVLLGIAVAILLADQISSGLIKNLVMRPRPSHNDDIVSVIHLINDYRGGMYGFVSSHAANCFALIVFLSCLFKHRIFTLTGILWAGLVSYSRIYIGVHYPGDILGGIIVGVLTGFFIHWLYCKIAESVKKKVAINVNYTQHDSALAAGSIILMIFLWLIVATF